MTLLFQPLLLVRLTDQLLVFYENFDESIDYDRLKRKANMESTV